MKKSAEKNLIEVFAGSPWEAELIKGLLESQGVQAVLKDAILGTLTPYISPEVAVLVNQENYESAMELIRNRDRTK
ncbi:MAG: DUF2007 domain-containing protein [Bacteroides sp.]|nr:DUF2007 domain-containing protein [Bacteroides sp.]